MRSLHRTLALTLLGLVPWVGSCRSAYYSTMEAFGVHKRDILVDRVEEGRESQEEAKEQFQTTLDVFKELTGFDGGDLERVYKSLKREFERSERKAEDVSERIDSIQKVAEDLFAEWKEEIGQISSPDLRARSQAMLDDTRERYEHLIGTMRDAEATMAPVLRSFQDHVLFLKHSLNAQAIEALRVSAEGIEFEVSALLEEMQASIDEADAFIAAMQT